MILMIWRIILEKKTKISNQLYLCETITVLGFTNGLKLEYQNYMINNPPENYGLSEIKNSSGNK